MNAADLIKNVKFDANGLVPAIAQDFVSGEVLMMAWMNAEAIEKTIATQNVYYWSRARSELWRKGATSGHTQKLKEMFLDCDGDTILLKIEQIGVACHTGERTCFFKQVL